MTGCCCLSRSWFIVEIWGKAKHQDQDKTFGVLERRKVTIWSHPPE